MFCIYCGNKLSDRAQFCSNCGNKVNNGHTDNQKAVSAELRKEENKLQLLPEGSSAVNQATASYEPPKEENKLQQPPIEPIQGKQEPPQKKKSGTKRYFVGSMIVLLIVFIAATVVIGGGYFQKGNLLQWGKEKTEATLNVEAGNSDGFISTIIKKITSRDEDDSNGIFDEKRVIEKNIPSVDVEGEDIPGLSRYPDSVRISCWKIPADSGAQHGAEYITSDDMDKVIKYVENELNRQGWKTKKKLSTGEGILIKADRSNKEKTLVARVDRWIKNQSYTLCTFVIIESDQ